MYAWGDNYFGQLCIGSMSKKSDAVMSPVEVTGMGKNRVLKISGSEGHTLILAEDGNIYSGGRNFDGELGKHRSNSNTVFPEQISTFPTAIRVIDIAATKSSSVALSDEGAVYTWGTNMCVVLGLGNVSSRSTPTLVSSLKNERIMRMVAGEYHVLVLSNTGKLWTWGGNEHGQLGIGLQPEEEFAFAFSSRLEPVQPKFETNVQIVTIGAGLTNSFAVALDNTFYSWGGNAYGQLGLGDTSRRLLPAEVPIKANLRRIACGNTHTIILSDEGKVFTCGSNEYGELCLGTTADRNTFAEATAMKGVQYIAGGYHVSFFTNGKGVLYGCGLNDRGQLGINTGSQEFTPIPTLLVGEPK